MPSAHVPQSAKILIDGSWMEAEGGNSLPVTDPYRNVVTSYGPQCSAEQVYAAVTTAAKAKGAAAKTKGYERASWLEKAATLLKAASASIAETLSRETGKAITDTRVEVQRATEVLRLSAGEAVRLQGEHVPLDATEPGAGKIAMLLPFPVGVVAGIVPFNAPVNLTCHKVGPAIAAGNAIVLKAPPQCPLTIHRLTEIFVESGIPSGFLNVLYGDAEVGRKLVTAPHVDFISFTGSVAAGTWVKSASGMRRVSLELGGIGPTIVHSDADVAAAAMACARNSMRLAGQSCLSVQNVFVHESLVRDFLDRLLVHVEAMKCGDPLDSETDVGTLVDVAAAQRVEAWVNEAVSSGATVAVGGRRHGASYAPTVLQGVRPEMKVVCQEIFGPVLSLQRYDDLEQVIEWLNSTDFGLHCGIYTASIATALRCIREVRCGGIIVNGTSTFRTEQQPYGGIKHSGIGREGPHYAVREMTESRFVVFNG